MRTFLFTLFICFAATPAMAFLGLFGGPETVTAEDGAITIDISGLSDNSSKHYQYREGGTVIRFFLVRDAQGTPRAALDACEVCWRENKGYKLQNGAMLCINCGQRFALNRIGYVRGGCNPHPIAFTVVGDTLTISSAELTSGAGYFQEER